MYSTSWTWRRSARGESGSQVQFHRADAPAGDDLITRRVVVEQQIPERADCCSARATYVVLIPASASRPVRSELFLCGHHLRAHARALAERQVVVFDRAHQCIEAVPEF